MNKNAPTQLRDTAEELTQMKKIVFSKTLKSVKWRNSELVKGNLVAEVKKLKKGNGPDMVIFGSGTIIQQLTVAGLIDEFVLVETPVVLGKGKSFFKDVKKLGLELLKSKDFKSGNVLLHYKVRK
jgi:dihydrofolate reductase